MAKIKFPRIVDNVIKCMYCGNYIQYDAESIYKEAYFDTDEYNEGHFYEYIDCPNCHKHLPLNISLGARIAMLEELLAFMNKKDK